MQGAVTKTELASLSIDNFWETIEAAETLVIVDCYTAWCGPCKLILPEVSILVILKLET